jgi:hypothetical protein
MGKLEKNGSKNFSLTDREGNDTRTWQGSGDSNKDEGDAPKVISSSNEVAPVAPDWFKS